MPPRVSRFSSRDIRAFMFGSSSAPVAVLRQARRIRPDDTDEIVVARRGGDVWIGQRLGERVTTWACPDDVDADEQFERLIDGDGWAEARPVPGVA